MRKRPSSLLGYNRSGHGCPKIVTSLWSIALGSHARARMLRSSHPRCRLPPTVLAAPFRHRRMPLPRALRQPSRSSRFPVFDTCQRPPRRVCMPRAFSSPAMARRLVAPPARVPAITGAWSRAWASALTETAALSAVGVAELSIGPRYGVGPCGRTEVRNGIDRGAGLSKDGSHGEAPISQHRVQASGRPGIPGR